MFKYDGTSVSENIYTNKIGGLHECIICHYQYLIIINFRFQPKTYNIEVVPTERNYSRILFWFMTKIKAEDRMKNAYLREKNERL